MLLEIKHQEHYSRKELLLRSFLGFFYIIIPHAFLLLFAFLASVVLQFLTFWVILFTGRFPESWFEFQVKFQSWNLRVNASIFNLVDGYPAFGFNGSHPSIEYQVPYSENISRSSVLLRGLFGWIYVGIPHGIVLLFLSIAVQMVVLVGWFIVLFTGKYPKELFDFVVGFFKWSQRVTNYLAYMTDQYPPFSFKEEA